MLGALANPIEHSGKMFDIKDRRLSVIKCLLAKRSENTCLAHFWQFSRYIKAWWSSCAL